MGDPAQGGAGGDGVRPAPFRVVGLFYPDLFRPPADYDSEVTFGPWLSEEEAAADFDSRAEELERRGYWRVYKEVRGEYLQPRMVSDEASTACRADRILVPKEKLISLGWPHGPIGIEIENSRMKVAKPITQADGYSRAVWHLPFGFHVLIEWWFVWCWDGGAGNVASLAAQHRVGGVWGSAHAPLIFQSGGTHGIAWRANGEVSAKGLPSGKKAGHRSGK